MPIIETKGAASSQGFGQFASTGEAVYIESVFQTYLYDGNGSTQTITNGIDLSGKGGMVWVKRRNSPANDHAVMDTARGIATNGAWTLIPDDTFAQFDANVVTAFNSNGFTLGSSSFGNSGGGFNYASWTFREQAKFFDIVTYTGNGVGGRTVPHNLGSVPGCIIVKNITTGGTRWPVYHRSAFVPGFLPQNGVLFLNTTDAHALAGTFWNNTAPTQTSFTVGSNSEVNANGSNYVAYLFAHDAGGFGLTGTDNVISCGSFTTDGSGFVPDVNLGYEPQWILLKQTNSANSWFMFDNMRGWSQTNSQYLYADSSMAEASWNGAAAQYYGVITPTGFKGLVSSGINNGTFIYIAIRRGPMKTPTTGTSVFSPNAYSTTGAAGNPQTTGFPVDWMIQGNRSGGSVWPAGFSRLQGGSQYLQTSSTAAEATQSGGAINFDSNTNFSFVAQWFNNGAPSVSWSFRRAPGFFDVVCYTGTGAAALRNHNLGVAPELMIIKSRNFGGQAWAVYSGDPNQFLRLNTTAQIASASDTWNYTTPTSTQFGTGTSTLVGASGWTYVAYLFASCPGVSKVGTYTGTGALQTINCGFTGGARFVLIKRTDSTGDWWVYDSARGISSGNDPYLLLNSTAAEVTGTNYVDTTSVGFQVTAAAPAGLNASGGTYIFLAIA